jgi:hypothetical protein
MFTRRDFVKGTALASAAVPLVQAQPVAPPASAEAVNPLPVRVGMTDWNLGQRGDISKIALAREIGLDGIQVSLQFPTDGTTPTLRDAKTQAAFKRAALETSSPTNDIVADTRANIEYVKKTFRMPAPRQGSARSLG